MKKTIALVALVVLNLSIFAQVRDTFILTSIPTYDENGNLYGTQKSYDHIPTRQDSLDFRKLSDSVISVTIDSVRKAEAMSQTYNKKSNSYPVFVAAIRYTKNNGVLIKPISNHKVPWYRYYDRKVKVGDLILVSKTDIVKPTY